MMNAISQQQNARGEWVPAIPLPFFFWLGLPYTQCTCGAKFIGPRSRALRRYEEHYALAHILKPGPHENGETK